MDVALASQSRIAGHRTATRVVRDVRPQKFYSPKALHMSDHVQSALEEEHVPLIDLAHLSVSSSHNPARTKAALAKACNEWGFFQVINHGVSQELVQSFRAQCLDLFSLPMEQKLKAEREGISIYGYSFRPNTGPSEVLLVPGWDESFIADYGRKLFPSSSEHFCAVYKELNAVLRKLAIRLLGLVIEGLGVSPKQFEAYINEAEGSIGARCYHRSTVPDGILGLHAHVDWNLISIVHQHEVGGLQVLKDEKWYSIQPRPDSFAINVGDCLQALTNGKLRSVQHRVVTSKAKSRLSIGYFLNPPPSTTVLPISDFVDSNHPPLYKPFTWKELTEAQNLRPILPSPLTHFEAK